MRALKPWLSLAVLGACVPPSSPAPVDLARREPVPDSSTARLDLPRSNGRVVDPLAFRLAGGPAVWVWIEALAPGERSETRPHQADWTLTPLLPE
jgi:hypothetical protein